MKEYGKKISRYLMKNKKGRFYCVAGVLYLLAILFVMNDAWLYQTPIVKVTKVDVEQKKRNISRVFMAKS